jgi:PAS domain S-box-containing protein
VPFSHLLRDNAQARLAGLLDAAMDAIITVDAAQRIVMYNRAAERIFGWPVAEVMGQSLEKLIPNRYRATHGEHVARFGDTGVTNRRMSGSAIVFGLRASGEEFPVDASISQLDTPDGKLYTVILRDVTERERARADLAAFAAEASNTREQEKSRIARELHDELAQSLTALKMDVIWVRDRLAADPESATAKLGQMLAMIDGAVAATRRISADLRPLVLDDLGLGAAIEWVAHNFTQRTGIPCDVDMDDELDLPEPYATAVFRIVQESLQNAAKHAQASRVQVKVEHNGHDLVLRVQDDGRGFDMTSPRKPQSLGLVGLRERALLLRGSVKVSSAPGQGTVVEAHIPLREVEGGA